MSDEEIRKSLIEMRLYVIYHGIPLGECVAWNKLKAVFDVDSAFSKCKGCGKLVLAVAAENFCNDCFSTRV